MTQPVINLSEVAAALIAEWRKAMDTADKQLAYYKGAINGVDLLLQRIGKLDNDSQVPRESGGK